MEGGIKVEMHKKSIITVSSCALLAVVLVGGSLAWFTDSEIRTNEFNSGKIDIDLRENEDGNTTGIQVDGIIAGTTIDKRVDVRVPKGTSTTLIRVQFKQTLLIYG